MIIIQAQAIDTAGQFIAANREIADDAEAMQEFIGGDLQMILLDMAMNAEIAKFRVFAMIRDEAIASGWRAIGMLHNAW